MQASMRLGIDASEYDDQNTEIISLGLQVYLHSSWDSFSSDLVIVVRISSCIELSSLLFLEASFSSIV